eukprot:NODE_78_length_23230_cov_1.644979.p1 type:complete len:1752 gc:universal NODE_78_length_23230_cov_1.644979:21158-15903(-)
MFHGILKTLNSRQINLNSKKSTKKTDKYAIFWIIFEVEIKSFSLHTMEMEVDDAIIDNFMQVHDPSIASNADQSSNEIINTSNIVQHPRPYQQLLFRKACKENIIAFLETGTGKTLIACLLAKEYSEPLDLFPKKVYDDIVTEIKSGRVKDKSEIFNMLPTLNKKVIFLVPTTTLVKQQTIQLQHNAELVVKEFQGQTKHDKFSDTEDGILWHRTFSETQAIVMTPQILMNLLQTGFIRMTNISLLILDEAHHCSGDHVYKRIMLDYYKATEPICRPRVFGMTASPLASKSQSDIKLHQDIYELESIMMSKISTVPPEMIDAYLTRAKTKVLFFSRFYPKYDIKETKIIMENRDEFEKVSCIVYRHFMYYRQKLYLKQNYSKNKESEGFKRMIRNGDYINNSLGPWLAGRYLEYCFFDSGELKGLMHYNKLIGSTSSIRSKNDLISPDSADVEPILFISSKLINLLIHLNRLYDSSDEVKSLIFINNKAMVTTLASFLHEAAHTEIVPYSVKPYFLHAELGPNVKEAITSNFNSGKYNLLVTTDVSEEGIDISSCNIVFMFEVPKTSKEMIQTRGRARKKNSEYIIFLEDGDKQSIENFAARNIEEYFQTSTIRGKQHEIQNDDEVERDERLYQEASSNEHIESDAPFRVGLSQINLSEAMRNLETYLLKQDWSTSISKENRKPTLKLIIAQGRMPTKTVEKYLFRRNVQARRIMEKSPPNHTIHLELPPSWKNAAQNIRDDNLDDYYREVSGDLNIFGPFPEVVPGKQPRESDTVIYHEFAYEISFPNVITHFKNETIIGPPRFTMKAAKHAAALMAIKRLYSLNGLDKNLLPVGSQGGGDSKLNKLLTSTRFKSVSNVEPIKVIATGEDYGKNSEDKLMNHDTLNDYKRSTSSYFKGDYDNHYYPIAVSFGPEALEYLQHIPGDYLRSFCFLTAKPLEGTIPESLIWINQQIPCRVSFHQMLPIDLDENMLKDFQKEFWNLTLRKQNHMDLRKRLELIFQEVEKEKGIQRNNFSEWVREINSLNFMNDVSLCILPCVSKAKIAAKYLEPKFSHLDFEKDQNYKLEYISRDTICKEFLIDYGMMERVLDNSVKINAHSALEKMIARSGEIGSDFSNCNIVDGEFEKVYHALCNAESTNFNQSEFLKIHPEISGKIKRCIQSLAINSFNRSYFIEGIETHLTCASEIMPKYTYQSYYKKKHDYDLKYKNSPLIRTKNSYTLKNHESPKSVVEAKAKNQNTIYIPPEVCTILPFSVSYLKISNLIPSIFYKLETITHAFDIQQEFKLNLPHLDRIVQALTHTEAMDFQNYERLEFLGDAFLKYAVGLDLYRREDSYTEGDLSKKRTEQVRNSNLFRIAKTFRLPERMKFKRMDEALFCLDFMEPELFTKVHVVNESKISTYERWDGVRSITNKCVADLVESLIGAIYCTAGEQETLKFMVHAGLCYQSVLEKFEITHGILKSLSYPRYQQKPVLTMEKREKQAQCENIIRYKFKNIKVFEECSTIHLETGKCKAFDRLEYLGDAALDFCCALYSYVNFPLYLPGKLSNFKQRLVENVAFSRSCFEKRLFKFVDSNYSEVLRLFYNIDPYDVDTFEATCRKYDTKKLFGDIFESFCGGVFIDSGESLSDLWKTFGEVIIKVLVDESESIRSHQIVLRNYLVKKGLLKSKCEIFPELDVNGTYKCTVFVDGIKRGTASNKNQDKAVIESCYETLKHFSAFTTKELYKFQAESSRESVIKNIFGAECNKLISEIP